MTRFPRKLRALTALLWTACPSPARAAPCTSLPNPLVVTGSSAVKPLLAEIAKVLVAAPGGTGPVSIVYLGAGSCVDVAAVLNGTPVSSTSLSYWDTLGIEQSCSLDAAANVPTNIGVSDVFAST